MTDAARAPRVLSHEWGVIEVDGIGRMKDAKLWPGGAREWDWDETGTRHRPGIQPADLDELLAHDPDVVVLSRGRELRLRVMPETLRLLKDRGIEVVHDETGASIERYNELAGAGRRVAALLHSTC